MAYFYCTFLQLLVHCEVAHFIHNGCWASCLILLFIMTSGSIQNFAPAQACLLSKSFYFGSFICRLLLSVGQEIVPTFDIYLSLVIYTQWWYTYFFIGLVVMVDGQVVVEFYWIKYFFVSCGFQMTILRFWKQIFEWK